MGACFTESGDWSWHCDHSSHLPISLRQFREIPIALWQWPVIGVLPASATRVSLSSLCSLDLELMGCKQYKEKI